MSLSLILRAAHRSIASCVLPTVRSLAVAQPFAGKSFHLMCGNHIKTEPSLLQSSSSPVINAVCGMKTKGRLNRRCKSCYIVRRKGRMYVMCKAHPRHKQQAIVKNEENTWILTHFTTGKRAWGKW